MLFNIKIMLFIVITLSLKLFGVYCDCEYQIGVGIADITGPAAEINMMGYAKTDQNTCGIHTRLYARVVIIVDSNGNRVCFISCDINDTSQIIKIYVIKALNAIYNGTYNDNNVMISSTHTHSGPGGYLQYVLYIVTSNGFIPESFNPIVSGIVRGVQRAHSALTCGSIYINSGQLLNASINRSPTAYANNPETEKTKYDFNTDKQMTVLCLVASNGTQLAVISWFAVHCTSMNNTNCLISGDNKGYASQLYERDVNGDTILGKGPFVAFFAQSNEGDVSPNINGPHCLDTGLPCDNPTSTCNGKNENCVASGPGSDMFESTKIIGYRQYIMAKELCNNATTKLNGPIKYIHQTIDMSNVTVILKDNSTAITCKPAMGYSFAAGTTDGPGMFDFTQGATGGTLFWNTIRDVVTTPSPQLVACQQPKPILLATGEMNVPYAWQPVILPTQIFKIGQLIIAAVPGELTTMAGRRLRDRIRSAYNSHSTDGNVSDVVIAGLSGTYSSYVTTFEEYQIQRYEGASTIYGPHTLSAYMQQYSTLSSCLATGQAVTPGPLEPDLLSKQIDLTPPVVFDAPPIGHKFCDVLSDANNTYRIGDTVTVSFVSGHPRNNLHTDGTFLTVERLNASTQQWTIVATDANWDTKFMWLRTNVVLGTSQVTIMWTIPLDTPVGSYRIRYFGDSKNVFGQISSCTGTSKIFSAHFN